MNSTDCTRYDGRSEVEGGGGAEDGVDTATDDSAECDRHGLGETERTIADGWLILHGLALRILPPKGGRSQYAMRSTTARRNVLSLEFCGWTSRTEQSSPALIVTAGSPKRVSWSVE